MTAIANGMLLHGGLKTYTATFFVFVDYMKPMPVSYTHLDVYKRQVPACVYIHNMAGTSIRHRYKRG